MIDFHFNQMSTSKSEHSDSKGHKKLSFVCEETGTDLTLFLWTDQNNDAVGFQFFFYEKVIEWHQKTGIATYKTNRLEESDGDTKIGVQKGTRTLVPVDDPEILNEAIVIINKSIFPTGIKDILKAKF